MVQQPQSPTHGGALVEKQRTAGEVENNASAEVKNLAASASVIIKKKSMPAASPVPPPKGMQTLNAFFQKKPTAK